MIRELITASQMWRHLNCSRRQIVEYQNRRLRSIVAYAYENVPYYRRLFDEAGVRPGDIQVAADLIKVPITTKSALHQTPAGDFIARGFDISKLIVRTSGGSTGEPVRIRRTWAEERLLTAFRIRARRTMGLRASDRTATISLLKTSQHADRQIVSHLLHGAGLYCQTHLNALLSIEDLAAELERFNPDIITGYAGAIAMVAQYQMDHGRTGIRPRLVTTGAEVLTPLMRRQIAQAFGTPVYNVYGANEVNLVAWECTRTGQMHVCDDLAVVEILRNNRPVDPGERGEVLVTCLHSFAMPVIRFTLNDIATRGSDCCACGIPFATIGAVQGRMIDYFPLPDGRLIHPYEVIDKIIHDRADWLKQYQVIQERQDLIVLRMVKFREPSEQRMIHLRADAAAVFGPSVEFRVDFLPELKVEPNGKFRTARSFIRSQYDGIDWDRVENEPQMNTDKHR